MRLLDEDEAANPALSVVNLIDVFLVLLAALLISIAQNPINPFLGNDVMVIKNPGQQDMEIVIKKGEKIETYKSTGEIGAGEGVKAGVAYRMPDGSIIYVPDDTPEGAAPAPAAN
ncbi:DUF2149 domain-containing protein [Paremcibacter congregatus]|uniref:DUF2149 domain-containing protein n=1 Tax=Paremcibacter congregatus TaxID=2043170 RepID=A0A2G4YS76_9PROT|nr:DUF2149 domain-containing protein [Paremcibacter congregatus]PHZ85117.1 hypothetical protein CRD36_06790 [Paremcibacter congregatus]QDE27948.1 DUF2149 domain-containing protein [Paremcibacter congregatus]